MIGRLHPGAHRRSDIGLHNIFWNFSDRRGRLTHHANTIRRMGIAVMVVVITATGRFGGCRDHNHCTDNNCNQGAHL